MTLGILLLFLGHANDDAKEEESIKFKKGKVTKEESMVRKSPGRIGAIKMAKQPRDLCQVPSHQYGQDRRRDTKAPLKIVSFNVEWLFLKGGKGAIKCPSSSCPWRVSEPLPSIDRAFRPSSLALHDCRMMPRQKCIFVVWRARWPSWTPT